MSTRSAILGVLLVAGFAVIASSAPGASRSIPPAPAHVSNDLDLSLPAIPCESLLKADPVPVGLLIPGLLLVEDRRYRAQSMNNLKQMGLALHNYESVYGHFPEAAAIVDKNGKPLLSWRVAILPYLEQVDLYGKFKLDEPWDSPTNKPLAGVVVKLYQSPDVPRNLLKPGLTCYKAVRGPGALFEHGKQSRINDITDGTSNTIMLVEAGDPVIWTKPDEFEFDPKKPLPKLMIPGGRELRFALADGSVGTRKTLKDETFRALCTRTGGEVIPADY